jgi:hypothetical protein
MKHTDKKPRSSHFLESNKPGSPFMFAKRSKRFTRTRDSGSTVDSQAKYTQRYKKDSSVEVADESNEKILVLAL